MWLLALVGVAVVLLIVLLYKGAHALHDVFWHRIAHHLSFISDDTRVNYLDRMETKRGLAALDARKKEVAKADRRRARQNKKTAGSPAKADAEPKQYLWMN